MLSLVLGGLSAPAAAFSLGSPVCEVNSLPLVPMSSALASPPPSGWQLQTSRSIYMPGRPITVWISHPSVEQTALGVLIWAKRGFATGAGEFEVDGQLYQHVPLPAECGSWAATHTSPVVKSQAQMSFSWQSDEAGEVLLRAFLIENCGVPGGCRGHQALTPVHVLRPVMFFSGFEADD